MTLNPYQGLKRITTMTQPRKAIVPMTLNPYQGLKQFKRPLGTLKIEFQ
ncbi:MAG: hypothetical protein ACLGGO_05690 [Coleofasciculus sp.]